MKTIKCIKEISENEYVCYSVTVGKIYEVISDSGSDYFLKDDSGEERYYSYKFFEACGIETEKIFKGSDLQYWSNTFSKWMELAPTGSKYRIKPDHSAEIEELEKQIEILKNK